MIKKILGYSALVIIAITLVSCISPEPKIKQKRQLILRAGNPDVNDVDDKTRTEIVGMHPHWSPGDVIGVYVHETTDNHRFISLDNSGSPVRLADFSGDAPDALHTITAYYPHSNHDEIPNTNAIRAIIDIPAVQNPTPTSFDNRVDIMLSQQISLDENGIPTERVQFERLGGILKVVLKDVDGILTSEYVKSLSVTVDGDNHLVGRMGIDLTNRTLIAPYDRQSKIVTANYTAQTQYAIGDENAATYLGVNPCILSAGTKLTISAGTHTHSIKKVITLQNPIEIKPGRITTLNVSINAGHIRERSLTILSVGTSYGNLGTTTPTNVEGVDSKGLRDMLLNTNYFGPNGTVHLSQSVVLKRLPNASAGNSYRSSDPTSFIANLDGVDVVILPGYGLKGVYDLSPECAQALVEWLSDPQHVLVISLDDNSGTANQRTRDALGNKLYTLQLNVTNILDIDNELDPQNIHGVLGDYAYYGSAPDNPLPEAMPFINGPFGEVSLSDYYQATEGIARYMQAESMPEQNKQKRVSEPTKPEYREWVKIIAMIKNCFQFFILKRKTH